jgi:hypothetical protein
MHWLGWLACWAFGWVGTMHGRIVSDHYILSLFPPSANQSHGLRQSYTCLSTHTVELATHGKHITITS